MILDCERHCKKYNWSLSGHCPNSYADNDGGVWCFEECKSKKTKEKPKKSYKRQACEDMFGRW